MAKIISALSSKGGAGKTTATHLLCWGAARVRPDGVESINIATDPRREYHELKRPYAYFDCRSEDALEAEMKALLDEDGDFYIVIDGAAGEEADDKNETRDEWLSRYSDLVMICGKLSSQDVEAAISLKNKIPKEIPVIFVAGETPDKPSSKRIAQRDKIINEFGEDAYFNVPSMQDTIDFADPEVEVLRPSTSVNKRADALFKLVSDLAPL